MKIPLFNYSYQILNILNISENDIVKCVKGITEKHFITNPILATLSRTYFDKEIENSIISIPDDDLLLTRLSGHILTYIKDDITKNINYKEEVKRKFLSYNEGPFTSSFSEIFVGGYLKFLGLNIDFSSSKEKGSPDIKVTGDLVFSSDIKTFPDMEFWLKDQVSSLSTELIKIINQCRNFNLMIFVTRTKGFKKEVVKSILNFLNTRKTQQGKTCMVTNMPQYEGNQGYTIGKKSNNVVFRFIPNFTHGDEELNALMEKAIKQQNSKTKDGITWMMFPHPKSNPIFRRLVWEVSTIPKKMQESGTGLILYELFSEVDPKDNTKIKLHSAADFLINDNFSKKINRKSFDEYISFLLSKPTIFIK